MDGHGNLQELDVDFDMDLLVNDGSLSLMLPHGFAAFSDGAATTSPDYTSDTNGSLMVSPPSSEHQNWASPPLYPPANFLNFPTTANPVSEPVDRILDTMTGWYGAEAPKAASHTSSSDRGTNTPTAHSTDSDSPPIVEKTAPAKRKRVSQSKSAEQQPAPVVKQEQGMKSIKLCVFAHACLHQGSDNEDDAGGANDPIAINLNWAVCSQLG